MEFVLIDHWSSCSENFKIIWFIHYRNTNIFKKLVNSERFLAHITNKSSKRAKFQLRDASKMLNATGFYLPHSIQILSCLEKEIKLFVFLWNYSFPCIIFCLYFFLLLLVVIFLTYSSFKVVDMHNVKDFWLRCIRWWFH